nr:iron-containing alcohol dehydrogenase [uncultured Victivallis sp.]
MFHNSLDIHEIKELHLNTLVSFGCGAIRKIEEIAAALEKRGVRSLPAVTGRGAYKTTGTWDYVVSALEKHHIKYVLCDKVTSDPTTAQIDEAALMTGLFEKQTRFVSIDAVNHSVEAVTSAIASPLRKLNQPQRELKNGSSPAARRKNWPMKASPPPISTN